MTAPRQPLENTSIPAAMETAPRPRPRVRRPALLGAAVLIPTLALGSAVAASAHKTVQLDVDGQTRTVSTWAGSVDGLLKAQGITLAEHDEVAPRLETGLSEDATVVVRLAEQVDVVIDGAPARIWTTADSAAEVLADLQSSGRSAAILASSRSSARTDLGMPLTSGGVVRVKVDGGETGRRFEGATTLPAALSELGVTLGETDETSVAPADDGAVVVTITRVVHGERTEVQPIAFTTEERANAQMYKGESRVVQKGAAGERSVTFRTVTVDGVETEAVETASTVTREPVTKVVEVGSKPRPAAPAGAAPAGVWAALAQCESGGNPAAVSASGTYHGLYQFTVSTWAAMGGSGLPSQASAAEQTMRAQMLQARSGWGQWPACARKLGLL